MARIKKYELFINDEYVTSDASVTLNKYETGHFYFTTYYHNTVKEDEITKGKTIKLELKEDCKSVFVKNVEIIDGSCETNSNPHSCNKDYRIYFKVLEDLIKDEKYYFYDWASMFYKEFYFQEELDNGQCLGYTLRDDKKHYGIVKKEDIITDFEKTQNIEKLNKLKKEQKQISDRLYEIQEEIRLLENKL